MQKKALKKKKPPVKQGRKQRQKALRLCTAFLLALALFGLFAMAAGATGAGAGTGITEVDSMFGNITSILYGIARFAGGAVCLFGIIQIGMSISSHDASQRVQGFLVMAGGVIIFFSPTIIAAFTG